MRLSRSVRCTRDPPHGVSHIFTRIVEWLLLVLISYVTLYYIFDILNFIIRIGSDNLQGI